MAHGLTPVSAEAAAAFAAGARRSLPGGLAPSFRPAAARLAAGATQIPDNDDAFDEWPAETADFPIIRRERSAGREVPEEEEAGSSGVSTLAPQGQLLSTPPPAPPPPPGLVTIPPMSTIAAVVGVPLLTHTFLRVRPTAQTRQHPLAGLWKGAPPVNSQSYRSWRAMRR